jgi:hypothetical protein
MSWVLEKPDGTYLRANAWTWRPVVALLERHHLLDAEKLELLGYNVTVEITGDEAGRIAAFLDDYLDTVPAAGRVLLDGSVTTEPETDELYRYDPERNYSAIVGWLREFRVFTRDAPLDFTAG